MRILQVADGYPPVIGGVEVYVENLSRALVDAGHDVMVASLSSGNLPDSEIRYGIPIRRLHGISQHLPGAGHDPGHIFHPPVPDPPIVMQLQSIIKTFQPDVIHAHGWMLHSCLPLRTDAVLVAHLHEWGLSCIKKTFRTPTGACEFGPGLARCTNCAAEQYRGKSKAALLAAGLRADRALFGRVDAFIAISGAVASAASKVIPDLDRLFIIPTAVADGLEKVAEQTPRPSWLPSEPFLLFAGVLGPHKGIDVLLEAHQNMTHKLPLVMLGSRRHDTPVIDSSSVIVREDVDHDDVMVSWSEAAIGVVPSRAEAFGQVAVECQAVGTPVVVSNTGGLVDIVTDGVDGLIVPPGDAPALAAALDRLLDDPELCTRLGNAGRLRAQEFTLSAVLPAMEKIYLSAKHGGSSSTGHVA